MTQLIVLILVITLVVGCASHDSFTPLYNYYFPKHQKSYQGMMRDIYDRYLFSPNHELPEYTAHYRAFHGDSAAAHDFFNSSKRDADGEWGERWGFDCFILLLRLGDENFAKCLQPEDSKTREIVGEEIEHFLDPRKHDFPLTRALYNYRKSVSARPFIYGLFDKAEYA